MPALRGTRRWTSLSSLASLSAFLGVAGLFATGMLVGVLPTGGEHSAAPHSASPPPLEPTESGARRLGDGARATLDAQFPREAREVVETGARLAPAGDPRAPEGYYRILAAGQDGEVREPPITARLPARASDPVQMRLANGFSIDVREAGLQGRGEPVGNAIAYPRDGGYAYWSATDEGYEEWLLVAGGRASEVASWVVPQGTLRQAGEAVEVVDAKGEAQIRITAPRAYRRGGARVAAHVRADQNRIVASVDWPSDRFEEPLLVDPLWQVTASAPEGHVIHSAARLLDGRVLVVGGTDSTNQLTAAASIFDPISETWHQTAPMFDVSYATAAATLLDGRVLVSNGGGGALAQTRAGLFDPLTETWAVADPSRSLIGAGTRLGQVSVRLPDGKVLMTGNFCCPGTEAHIYDPVTDTIHPVQNMVIHRQQHTLTVLADGTVLAAGGGTTNPSSLSSNTAEIFIPDTSGPQPDYLNGHWQQVGNMSAGHADGFAVKLTVGPNAGKVMVCDGFDGATFPGSYFFTNTCDLYDPVTKTFSPTGSTNNIRQLSGTGNGGSVAAVIEAGPLAGYVLAAGGYPSMTSTEVYNPFTGVWQSECPMQTLRLRHTTTALTDGRVLVVGGQNFPGSQALVSADIWNPNTTLADANCNGVPDPIESCPTGSCVLVSGRVAADTTPSCSVDPGEPGVAGRMVRADDGVDHHYAVTNASGDYQLTLPAGNAFSVSLVPNTYTTESAACGAQQVYSADPFNDTTGADFALTALCDATVVVQSLPPDDPNSCPNFNPPHYASPCPGHPWRHCAVVTNTGSQPLLPPTQVLLFADPSMTFLSIDPLTTTCNGALNTLNPTDASWDIASLGAGSQCRVCVNVAVNSAPGAACYDTYGFLDGWCDPSSNVTPFYDKQECALCSCDPNDKSVEPAGCGANHLTPPTDLTYTVRFHNVGAGAAHDVVIRDDIDPGLDLESLRVLASSHAVSELRVSPPRGLVIGFRGIELPADQDDPAGSQGYVTFKLSPKAGLGAGTALSNMADVYFDNNPPVTTNAVVNTLNPAGTGAPTCVTIRRGLFGDVEDAHIATDKPGKNWGTSQSLAIGSVAPGLRQALVKWDLSAIPSCSTIASATAHFDVLLHGGSPLSLHRVGPAWAEGQVTHQSLHGGFLRDASATMAASPTPSADITSLVQAWVDGTTANHGVLIDQAPGGSTVLHSSESTDAARRPRLDVCYYPAP